MTRILTKRAYEPPCETDGFRVLVDRVWPRGIRKDALHLDAWAKNIAPSAALRRWFGHNSKKWELFKELYEYELRSPEALHEVRKLIERATGARAITLVYGASDTVHNQATVLRDLFERMLPAKMAEPNVQEHVSVQTRKSPALAVTVRVCLPYRLDLTVDALRRSVTNKVDVVTPDGTYRRAISHARGTNVVEVRQRTPQEVEVRVIGKNAHLQFEVVKRMLGFDVDLSEWSQRTRRFAWLARLDTRLRGVKPPRYPNLWEAICNAIVFQQISIDAAAAIMQRLVISYSHPIDHDGTTLYPFPPPDAIRNAPIAHLRSIGLSQVKASYLKSASVAIASGELDPKRLALLPSPSATAELMKLSGIGAWSASVVLLRGLGRLDAFPLNDSGVEKTIRAISGNDRIDVQRVLHMLGNVRGMLYFYLLLGRRYLQCL